MPRPDNAVVRLATFLDRVGRRRLPLKASPEVTRFLTELAAVQPRPARDVLPLLLKPAWSGLVLDRLVRDPAARPEPQRGPAEHRHADRAAGGRETNVIPGTTEAELDGRIAVGSTERELLAELRRLAGRWVDLEVLGASFPPTVAAPDTNLFRTLTEVDHHPGAVAVPSVTPGFTDAKYWSRLGTNCCGFAPVRLEPGDAPYVELFHGDDERIPLSGFTAGLRMLTDRHQILCHIRSPIEALSDLTGHRPDDECGQQRQKWTSLGRIALDHRAGCLVHEPAPLRHHRPCDPHPAVAPRAEGGDQKLPAGLLRQPAVDIRVVQAEMLLRSPRRARLGTARPAWPAAYPVLLGVVPR